MECLLISWLLSTIAMSPAMQANSSKIAVVLGMAQKKTQTKPAIGKKRNIQKQRGNKAHKQQQMRLGMQQNTKLRKQPSVHNKFKTPL